MASSCFRMVAFTFATAAVVGVVTIGTSMWRSYEATSWYYKEMDSFISQLLLAPVTAAARFHAGDLMAVHLVIPALQR